LRKRDLTEAVQTAKAEVQDWTAWTVAVSVEIDTRVAATDTLAPEKRHIDLCDWDK
jgi:hypothetical protein